MGSSGGVALHGSVFGPDRARLYVCDPGIRQSLSVATANRTYYLRRVSPAVPIAAVELFVGVSSGNICIAAYDHNPSTNLPTVRLATTGAIACPAPGSQSVSLGATVRPEWLSFSVDNGTASFAMTGGGLIVFTGAVGRTVYQDTTFPPPDPAAPVAAVSGAVWLLVGKP